MKIHELIAESDSYRDQVIDSMISRIKREYPNDKETIQKITGLRKDQVWLNTLQPRVIKRDYPTVLSLPYWKMIDELIQLARSSSPYSTLKEVSMSPSALADFAKTEVAQSMTVGFEAEMLVLGLRLSEKDEPILDPDWSADKPFPVLDDWKDIVRDFFGHGQWGNPLKTIDKAIDNIENAYYIWLEKEFISYAHGAGMLDLRYMLKHHLEQDMENVTDEDVTQSINNEDIPYQQVLEVMREEYFEHDRFEEFCYLRNIKTMKNFMDKFGGRQPFQLTRASAEPRIGYLVWPYMKSSKTLLPEDLEEDFTVHTGYSSTFVNDPQYPADKPDLWVFKPDTSIKGNRGYGGIELASPPMPFAEGMKALDTFFEWANSKKIQANTTTGFHMGVSIPAQTTDDIDHLKLILFLGDKHVLKKFDRLSTTYAVSSLAEIKDNLQFISNQKLVKSALETLKSGLNARAMKLIGDQIVPYDDKYMSVNIKDKYIEFRQAGGDYFEKQNDIKNTMLRYVRAMAIASDPNAELKEYAKKFYSLFSKNVPEEDIDALHYFISSSSGLTGKSLKAGLKTVQQKRKSKRIQEGPVKDKIKKAAKAGALATGMLSIGGLHGNTPPVIKPHVENPSKNTTTIYKQPLDKMLLIKKK